MFAMMPIIIPMNTHGRGPLTCNELIFTILIMQYVMVFLVLSVGLFYSKKRFFLNLIPFWFIVEFFIIAVNKIKELGE